MGAFGSILGGLMSVGGIFMAIWTMSTITDNYLVFLLYPIFGVIGGIALGALNSRKARLKKNIKMNMYPMLQWHLLQLYFYHCIILFLDLMQ